MADFGDRNAYRGEVAKAAARQSADREVEKALVELSSRVDHTYGELLMAAARIARGPLYADARQRRSNILGLITLVIICITIITIVWLVTR